MDFDFDSIKQEIKEVEDLVRRAYQAGYNQGIKDEKWRREIKEGEKEQELADLTQENL